MDIPISPVITNMSATPTSISILWEQEPCSEVLSYELQYHFNIQECSDYNEQNWTITIFDTSLRQYTILNSTETPVEEDSIYHITLTAVNSDGRRETSLSMIATPGASKDFN